MIHDILVWEQPPDMPAPTREEDVAPAIAALESRPPAESPVVAEFARLAGVRLSAPKGAILSFGLDPGVADRNRPLSKAVDAAQTFRLTVHDSQSQFTWLPWGRVVGPDNESLPAESNWAGACMPLYSAAEVPRTEKGICEALAPDIDRMLSPLGFKHFKQSHLRRRNFEEWRGKTAAGNWFVLFTVHDQGWGTIPRGIEWGFHCELTNDRFEAAFARAFPEDADIGKASFIFSLGQVLEEGFGRICSPETLRNVPRAVAKLLIPLLERMTTLQAMDEFANEATANPGARRRGLAMPILPTLREQDLSMRFSWKPLLVSRLAGSPRFEAVAAATREIQQDPEAYDLEVAKLRALTPIT